MDLRKWNLFPLLEDDFVLEIKLVCIFGLNGNEAIFVLKNGDVYGVGVNTNGCLGLGHTNSTLTPQKILPLCQKGVEGIAYGNGPHVVAYTMKGEVYTWGLNSCRELGNGTLESSPTPQLLTHLSHKVVVNVACGGHHALALTDEGEVYTWGLYKNGQAVAGTSIDIPRRITSAIVGKYIIGVACSQSSCFAISNDGEVHSWGCNTFGQLGIGSYVSQLNPCRVVKLSNTVIIKVVCGNSHVLALSDDCKVYAWGANTYGQLASDTNRNNVLSPEQILENIGRVVDIAASHYCHLSAAFMENSRIYMWGQCKGQSVMDPVCTPFSNLHEVFISFGSPSVTFLPVVFLPTRASKVENSMREAFNDQTTSDLIIRVEGKDIYVHKAVLKIRCQHFRTMFQKQWEEDTKEVLEISHFSYPVYKAFLQYLYTDQVCNFPEQAMELFILANAYCEESLKKLCVRVMCQGISIENAAVLYSNALNFGAKELEEHSFRFAMIHMTQVVLSQGFASLDLAILKNFITRAAQAGAFRT